MPSPLLDLRLLVRGLTALLPGTAEGAPPLPALPPPLPAAMALGPMGTMAAAGLSAHVNALQAALGGTGLWSDRPALLAALMSRHSAALREDMFGAKDWDRWGQGRGRLWGREVWTCGGVEVWVAGWRGVGVGGWLGGWLGRRGWRCTAVCTWRCKAAQARLD